MSETKDLAYYQANPNELGNLSDAELDALAEQGDTAAEPVVENNEPPAVVKEPEVKDEPKAEPEPQGVSTKDGKHIIPFEVLEKERNRAADLERIAQEQADQIAALKAQKAGEPSPEKAPDAGVTLLTDEELSDLERDLPAIGKLFRAQQEQLKTIGETVRNLNAERSEREAESTRTVQETVRDAIDSTPKLAYLQVQSPETWERAVRFDDVLKSDPAWAGKTYAERFSQVVKLYEATYGDIELPGQEVVKGPTAEELAQAAEAKLKAKQPAVPTSLSAIPGGSTPAADDVVAQLTSKSGPELTADFMRMTPQQIEAALARL